MQKPARFSTLPLGAVKPTGWMLNQMRRDLDEGFAGRLDELTSHAANDLFKNRIDTSTNHYAWWDSETRGNWLWGYVMMAYLADHDAHKARVDELLADLKATQDADGYIGVYSNATRYHHATGENGELWGQSRALLAMLAYYELTGDQSYLQAVHKAADLTLRIYGKHNPYFRMDATDSMTLNGGLLHGLNYIDAMEWLYRITEKIAYRDFAVWLFNDFCQIPFRFANDDITPRNLLQDMLEFSGHAVHTAEHIRTLLFAYFMTDDAEFGPAAEAAFRGLARYSTASGALIGDESIHGLPLPDMGYEYCTITEQMLSLSSALEKYGKARFGDWIENLTFNAGQGARFKDGSGICYLSTDNRLQAVASRPDTYSHWHTAGRFKFSPTHEDVAVCCNPNAIRLLPHYVSRMWMRLADDTGVAAVTFGPSILRTEVNNVAVTIHEETMYPFTETLTFRIEPTQSVAFKLLIRKPAWTQSTDIAAPGITPIEQNGFYVLEKTWESGDTVTVSFTATIETVENPIGEYHIRRGALFYAMNIEHELYPIRVYAGDMHDYDVLPAKLEDAYTIPILDGAAENYGLTLETRPISDQIDPWEHSPLQLTGKDATLVPMGATILRRSTFPVRNPQYLRQRSD